MRRPSLDVVRRYRNPDVVERFLAEWDVSERDARRLFDDMLQFLWLTTRADYMVGPVPIVDAMWHTFLMFTESYERWSRATFGTMLHHIPTTERDKRAQKRMTRDQLAAAIRRDVETVHHHLGEKIALRWYVLYADLYSPQFFRTARRPAEVSRSWFPPALMARARKLNRGLGG